MIKYFNFDIGKIEGLGSETNDQPLNLTNQVANQSVFRV